MVDHTTPHQATPYYTSPHHKHYIAYHFSFLPGSDIHLTGFYKERQDPIAKCASVAKRYGFQLFAIQNGGMCLSGPNAHDTYKIHGLAKNCKDGKGGPWASDVYIFNGKTFFVKCAVQCSKVQYNAIQYNAKLINTC